MGYHTKEGGIMTNKYALITFYKTQIAGIDTWLVYGHVAAGHNESLGAYKNRAEAIDNAFGYGIPVMSGNSYDEALARLTATP